MEEETQKCDVCDKPAQHRCGACMAVFYCSKEHQKLAWKTHKRRCRPFKICQDEQGYYLVATKPIKPGDVVLQELPMIWGPRQGGGAVCLSCLEPIDSNSFSNCALCGWTLCCDGCQLNPKHEPECHFTVKRRTNTSLGDFQFANSMYDGFFVMRCLYTKQFVPKVWGRLMRMNSGGEDLKKTRVYETAKEVLVKILYNAFNLKDEFTEEEIMTVWGILALNQLNITVGLASPAVIYEITSLIEHSCIANCYKTISEEGYARVIAGVPVEKGQRISLSIVYPLWTTLNRRRYIMQNKFIDCKCGRCSDPTEFGSNFSVHLCQRKGCGGIVLPKSFVIKGSDWTCTKCKTVTPVGFSEKIFQHVEQTFSKVNVESSASLKNFIENHRKLLPEKHGSMVNAKLPLIFMLGHAKEGGMKEISDADLELKEKLCREMMEILDLVAPAEKKLKIDMLVQLQSSLEEKCCRLELQGKLESSEFSHIMKERKLILYETEKLLKFEVKTSIEEQVCETTKLKLKME